jgi:crotonobetainyl-CoA:carnitine CoA-transferase CaiB-like acyl-CoA transferase
MRALVRASDVLVDNVRPGVLERLGLDAPALAALRRDLVHCSITGYGRTGPDARRPGFDPVFQARGGLMHAQGGGEEPVVHTIAYNDYCAGALGALATVAALYARQAHGGAQRVDVSLFRTAMLDQAAALLLADGVEPASGGGRDHLGPSATRRLYRCADDWLCVSAVEEDARAALADLAGTSLHDDAPAGPLAGALDAYFAARSRAEALVALDAARVPAAPCLRFPELLGDPQVDANACLVQVQDAQLGPVVMAGPSIHFERTPIVYGGGAPKLGADTEDVLRRVRSAEPS